MSAFKGFLIPFQFFHEGELLNFSDISGTLFFNAPSHFIYGSTETIRSTKIYGETDPIKEGMHGNEKKIRVSSERSIGGARGVL